MKRLKSLEDEIRIEQKDTLNQEDFKFVGLTSCQQKSISIIISGFRVNLTVIKMPVFLLKFPVLFLQNSRMLAIKWLKDRFWPRLMTINIRASCRAWKLSISLLLICMINRNGLWDQKIGSEVQYLQAKTNKESLERQISSLKDQIDKFKIKSPIDGTIEECNIKVGGVVSPDPRLAAYTG